MTHAAAEVFEDGIDLKIGTVEALQPDHQTSWTCYPFLQLKPTTKRETRSFRTIVLENPYLRATILPGLGGRIISMFDKRSGTEILPWTPAVEPLEGGRRGAFVREGVQLQLDGRERLNAMANVSTQFEQSMAEEQSEAAVWLAETCTGTGLSYHLRVSLPIDRAELLLEARVLNRWLRPQAYNGGLSLYLGPGVFDGSAFYCSARDAGLAVLSSGQPFDGVAFANGALQFSRFGEIQALAPRQVDTWSVNLVPLSGLGGLCGASRYAAASVVDGKLRMQVTEQRLNHKLLMLTADGQTLEAPVDLYPEHLLEIPLGRAIPIEFVLRNPAKVEILRCGAASAGGEAWRPTTPQSAGVSEMAEPPISLANSPEDLKRATFDVSNRHLALTLLGIQALGGQRFADAESAFEQALNFNAEDPLLWWEKALAARLEGAESHAELLNAHYLAPLEPALRAEGYLSQPVSLDRDPNPLLAPLEQNPEEFVEVACLLIEACLFDQASRWIDEALRHQELPMLRYLMAYAHLRRTGMIAEAAEQVRLASKSPPGPPFPYRDIERKALQALHEAFPGNQRVAELCRLLDVAT